MDISKVVALKINILLPIATNNMYMKAATVASSWQIWVNIGSANGLVPDGSKPLPEPMLNYDQKCLVASNLGQFNKASFSHQFMKISLKITNLKFHQNLPGANEFSRIMQVYLCM